MMRQAFRTIMPMRIAERGLGHTDGLASEEDRRSCLGRSERQDAGRRQQALLQAAGALKLSYHLAMVEDVTGLMEGIVETDVEQL